MSLKDKLKEWYSLWQDYKLAEKAYLKMQPDALDDKSFLPAALEVQETPPNPMGRKIIWVLCIFIVFSVIWASFGKVDIVAVGQGKIIPNGHTKVIQPLENSVVSAIHVENGQNVQKGDLLIELDGTQTNADRLRFKNEWIQGKADIARLKALLSKEEIQQDSDIPKRIIAIQQQHLQEQINEQNSRVSGLKSVIKQKEAEFNSSKEDVKRLESILPIVNEKLSMVEILVDEGNVSKYEALTLREEVITKEKDFAVLKERQKEIIAAVITAKEQLITLEAEYRKNLFAELSEKEISVSTLEKELTKAEKRNQLQTLVSPIDGTVQELAIHTIGGIVTPAQELMKIVPLQPSLEAQIFIPNKDIGFVYKGQEAKIKLDAFPFTKYGMIDGKVLHVSNDAIQDEELGLVFTARISMDKSTMKVEGKEILLTSGMSLSGEIKTGKRRVIEYFLSPILKYQAEVIRER